MKKNVTYIIIAFIIIISLLVGYIIYTNKSKTESDLIPEGYISVFHGGVGEITYETYIYKEDNDHYNSGFSYINVTNTTESYGSNKWISKITKHGSVQWTDDVFIVAKENNAYSFVTIPNSDKTYTIEEYMKMFLMN